MAANALFRPTFADLRAELERRIAASVSPKEIDELLEQFLLAGGDAPAPCVEYDGTVTWLYRSATAKNVAVVGDIIGHDPKKTRMTRLCGSDLFAFTAQIPLDARVTYSFVVDHEGADAAQRQSKGIADPLNPKRMIATNPLRSLSVLEMPNAQPLPEFAEVGAVGMTSLVYQTLGSNDGLIWARVAVLLPQGYDPTERRYPTLYMNDGETYVLSACLPQIMDVLVERGEAAPALVVLVQRANVGDQEAELSDEAYLAWMAEELVPWIDAHYATSTDPQERIIGGAGAHASFALWAELLRPDVFGGALAQSPLDATLALRIPELIAQNLSNSFVLPQTYIDVGRYEPLAQRTQVQAICAALLNYGAAVSYQDFGGDHSFVGWRSALPDALRFHFGAPPLPAL